MIRVATGLAALLLVATMAETKGGDRPSLPPRRDVAVTYRTTGAAAALIPPGLQGSGPAEIVGQMRLRWNVAGLLRLEAEGRPQFLVLDTAGPSAHVVDSTLRTAISIPMKPRDLDLILLTTAETSRVGEDRVAGMACTVWSVHARNGDGTVCITGDGVPLRVDGAIDGRKGTLTATAVDFSPQPQALFQVPAGYMSFSLPKFK